MIFSKCSSNGAPDAAAKVSSYSREIMFKITSEVKGEDERIKDSLQPVHSWPCNQITVGNSVVSAALTTVSNIVGGRPKIAVSATQDFINVRRLKRRSWKSVHKLFIRFFMEYSLLTTTLRNIIILLNKLQRLWQKSFLWAHSISLTKFNQHDDNHIFTILLYHLTFLKTMKFNKKSCI